jgi:diguanylate cyclase (GGDEF)-like protein
MFTILILAASTYVIDQQSSQTALERYRHLALHDPLTNLPNRAAFNEHLSSVLADAQVTGSDVAILTFDLDGFKEINDFHGHAAGDAVLRAIAGRVGAVLQQGQFLARVGGDEFTAITPHYLLSADAKALAARIMGVATQPIDWNDQMLSVGLSLGISTYPVQATTMDDLLAQADVAMYRAKATATNTVCFYDPTMDQASRERSALALEMRDGLRHGQFELFYQQQNDTRSRAVVGYEALLRWKHPVRGFVSPAEFIPIAERSGFILELGEWVLRAACKEASSWRNPLVIAVNVAAQQLADIRLPQLVHQILLDTGLPASRLELEITETGIIEDHQNALNAIRRLKAIGVKIAMDDYGTGYSSLSTLQTFPFDKIKIDRAFIGGVDTNPQSAAIVRSTLILAASLGIPVLAEGVESEEHIAFLREEGCLQVQGFLFGRPQPRAAIGDITALEPSVEQGEDLVESQLSAPRRTAA